MNQTNFLVLSLLDENYTSTMMIEIVRAQMSLQDIFKDMTSIHVTSKVRREFDSNGPQLNVYGVEVECDNKDFVSVIRDYLIWHMNTRGIFPNLVI